MELKVTEIKELQPIDFNYEELKHELTEKLKHYNSMLYTEDNIKQAKEDRANLNKLSKALNDRKIEVKNDLLRPYISFETKIKELKSLVDEASNNIDVQVKAYEGKIKEDKLQSIKMIYESCIGELKGLVPFERVWQPKWLNATERLTKVEKELMEELDRIRTEYSTLLGVIVGTDNEDYLKGHFFETLNLQKTLAYKAELEEKKAKLKELESTTEQVTEQVSMQVENAELYEVSFKVKATAEQLKKLSEFLISNNITYTKI